MTEGLHCELAEVLRREAGIYRSLAGVAAEQRDLLLAGKTDRLPENVRRMEKGLFALGPVVSRRRELSEKLGWKDAPALLSSAPEDVRPVLEAALREAAEAARGLERLQRGNEKLLKNASEYVGFTLRVLSGEKADVAVAGGAPKSAAPRSAFVNRVV